MESITWSWSHEFRRMQHKDTKAQRHKEWRWNRASNHRLAIEVHRTFSSPGLLESIYESALCHELILRGLRTQQQKPVQVMYKVIAIRESLFIDIVVEYKVLNWGQGDWKKSSHLWKLSSYTFKTNRYKI